MYNQKTLFISGGGHAHDTKQLDSYFVSSLRNKRILYIPIGLQKTFVGYDECFEWINNTLNQYTEKPLEIEMWVNLQNKKSDSLANIDAVYIGGGKNSYQLMKLFRETGFIDILRKYYGTGGCIYGGSTGAIIMGKYISVFGETPTDGYIYDDGLDLIGNYSIFCHYSLEREPKILNFIQNKKLPVIAIPENSGVCITNNILLVKGLSPVTIFLPDAKRIIIEPESTKNLNKVT